MFNKEEREVRHEDCLENDNICDKYDNIELQIDLDYNDNLNSSEQNDEPLDLSIKRTEKEDHGIVIKKFKANNVGCRFNFNFSNYQCNYEVKTNSSDIKSPSVTERDISLLIDPYIKSVNKRVICTVCEVKFVNKEKAKTHVENKHVDCLQYKCPLCRVTKVTRLAYESHLRRGHGARVKDYCPLIRLRKNFMVNSEKKTSNLNCRNNLEFVTFLRHILSLGQEEEVISTHTWHKTIPCAEWIDQDQGIFRINNRQEFAMGWCTFKVTEDIFCYCYTDFLFSVP